MDVVAAGPSEQCGGPRLIARTSGEIRNSLAHFFGIRAGGLCRRLCAAEAGGCDHLRRLGDFTDRGNARDPVSEGLKAWHQAKLEENASSAALSLFSFSGVSCREARMSARIS